MDMSNQRVDSHVAQKNRRHKLRFQQNSGNLSHQHQPLHTQFEQKDINRTFSYNPTALPSEMLASIARNPQLLLPPTHGYVSHDQDSNLLYPQDCNYWNKTIVSSQQEAASDHWNAANYLIAVSMNMDQRSLNSGYGYHQEPHSLSSSASYHNAIQQDHVTLALPPQKNDSGVTPSSSVPYWMNNSDESSVFLANRVHDHREQATTAVKEGICNTQGLSLTLSSVPQLKDGQPILHPGQNPLKSDPLLNPDLKSFMGVSAFAHRNTGPLGPFTGYATILKNSKYIKPAQELLNSSFEVGYQELAQTCHDAYSHKIIEEEMIRVSECPVASYGESDEHDSGLKSSGTESLRPGFHRKKAKLLYMQEEVCQRYKQYLQQMQLVISSFETVAGLSSATPYVCLALKAVSRHFRHVKNAISEQLSQMKKTVGEGLCSSTSISKSLDAGSSGVKSGGGFFAPPPQPVWRPQRGLPERAIAVLKTWLFDHFLHPYPSDADKHMLATQTGLTRNQVSNWFINARVRIWKPMVEEIHALETKGLAEPNSSQPQSGQDPGWMDISSLSNTQTQECSRNPGVNVNLTADKPHDHQIIQDHEKLARPEYQNISLSGMDRLMSTMPYPRATFDATGLGPVSLTLGLRQNAEHVQQLQQHFGGQLIHDFVG